MVEHIESACRTLRAHVQATIEKLRRADMALAEKEAKHREAAAAYALDLYFLVVASRLPVLIVSAVQMLARWLVRFAVFAFDPLC